jgi:hypothetical protein
MGTLANPTVEVNDTVISIVPNSLSFKTGRGDTNLRSQSAGGESIEVIKTVDAETKKGMVKFSMISETQNIELIKEWQDLTAGVTIRLSDGDFLVSFTGMHVMDDPEVTTGADGNTEVTFEGQPAV